VFRVEYDSSLFYSDGDNWSSLKKKVYAKDVCEHDDKENSTQKYLKPYNFRYQRFEEQYKFFELEHVIHTVHVDEKRLSTENRKKYDH